MTIGEFIKWARKNVGMSQSELARRLGITKTAVSNWEKGVSAPTRKRMVEVRAALGLPPSTDLDPELIQLSHIDVQLNARSIPLMEWGVFITLPDHYEAVAFATFPKLVADLGPASEGVALRIEDNPMPGDVSPGDIVIVALGIDPDPNDLVVALVGSDVVLRRYHSRGADSSGGQAFDLLSTNPDLPTRTVNSSNPGKVLGVVVEVRKRRR